MRLITLDRTPSALVALAALLVSTYGCGADCTDQNARQETISVVGSDGELLTLQEAVVTVIPSGSVLLEDASRNPLSFSIEGSAEGSVEIRVRLSAPGFRTYERQFRVELDQCGRVEEFGLPSTVELTRQ